MALINKQDTDGAKALLRKGELGYDDFPAGGDEGRVYVGTGAENIPISKKEEVDSISQILDSHIGSNGGAHALASNTQNGFMSNLDKQRLDGIEDNANYYVLPSDIVSQSDYATSAIGGTIKLRVDATTNTLYITTDGTDA